MDNVIFDKKVKITKTSFIKEYDYIEERVISYSIIDFNYCENNMIIKSSIKLVDALSAIVLDSSDMYHIIITDIYDRGLYNIRYMVNLLDDKEKVNCSENGYQCYDVIFNYENDESINDIPDVDPDSISNDFDFSDKYMYIKKFIIEYDENHNNKSLYIEMNNDINLLSDGAFKIKIYDFNIDELCNLEIPDEGSIRIYRVLDNPEYKYLLADEWYDDMYSEFAIYFNNIIIADQDEKGNTKYYQINDKEDLIGKINRMAWFPCEYDNIFIDLYTKAECGDVCAMMNLYEFFKSDEIKNSHLAFYWLKKAAEHGDADAQYKLGLAYNY